MFNKGGVGFPGCTRVRMRVLDRAASEADKMGRL